MTSLEQVYQRFVNEHYMRHPLRGREHLEALLEAAAVPPGQVDAAFWRRLRAEWLWGISPMPFDDAHGDRTNDAYRRLCQRRGVTP